MPGLTPTRVRLTLSQKVKIIEESKKSDFSRKKICEEYSISKAAISSILKDQKTHLENYDSGIPGKHKTMRKPDFPEIESTLYEWFTKITRSVCGAFEKVDIHCKCLQRFTEIYRGT